MAYIGPAPANSIIATSDIEDGAVTSAKIAASVAIAKGGTGTTTAAAAFTALASSQATVGDGSAGAPPLPVARPPQIAAFISRQRTPLVWFLAARSNSGSAATLFPADRRT